MRNPPPLVLPALAVLAALAACSDDAASPPATPGPGPAAGGDVPVLVAPHVGEPPLVDGSLADPAWRDAVERAVPVAGGGVAEVRLKAVHDDERVYLLAVWDDPERSMNRYWTDRGGLAFDREEREDAFLVFWAPGSDGAAFREQGCALYCHDGRHVYPGDGDGIVDAWRWGAQTTAAHPQAADLWMPQGAEHRLRGDNQPEGSDNIPNLSSEYNGPAYYPRRIGARADRILLAPNAFPVSKEHKRTKLAGPENVGREIPLDVLRPRAGSRGDVRAVARHHEGKAWVLELSRALRTGERDDLPFGDPLVPFLFAIAVCDDQPYGAHARSGPVELRFATPSR